MCRSLSDPPVRRVAPSLPSLLLSLVISCAVVCYSAVAVAEDARAENGGAKDATASPYASANRLAYLDEFCDPYYPSLDLPKLITPQWVGQEGVEAVITLGIDDMREAESYETYLRPILDRLKKIDGRAPVSILTNKIDPADPQLAKWLAEGLSLETHTADHPCPCLQGSDFAKAKNTYDRCVDQLAAIADSHPVAFRFPCCDSLNTPSPRAFAEILNRRTPQGNFCQIDTSVVSLLTAADDALPRELVTNDEGQPRFARYVPFKSFVNRVENYPYPFVIAGKLWEFPIAVPDDWQGQNLQAPRNPVTVEDTKVLIDATVLKRGVANLVFHPYNWLRNDQYVEIIDHAVEKYGKRVLFLNFRECLERLNRNLLAGQSLRAADGGDNGVRLLDVNNDGYMDVVIGNQQFRKTRIWQPQEETWRDVAFPVQIITVAADGTRRDAGVRFGVVRPDGMASFLVAAGEQRGLWHFDGQRWQRDEAFGDGPRHEGQPLITSREGRDQGVRLRDVDGDGVCEILVAGAERRYTLKRDAESNTWRPHSAVLPEPLVDASGRDAGLRLVDLNADGFADAVFSNERRFTVHLFEPNRGGWTRRVRAGARGDEDALPMIVRNGTNNGAWFAKGHLWIQNEDTHKLPDGVDRRSFAQLLGTDTPAPKSPQDSLESIRIRADLRVELVAAEPLTRDPIAIDWGADGKLWIVEMADYPLGMDNQGQPGGRVRYLEDTDGDGRYDRSQLFLDELAYPTGVMAWRDGVLVSVAPHILFARDTTGDGEADQVEVLYEGFGEENQQHRMNGFAWGLDNWLHLADGGSGGTVVSRKTGARVATRRRDMRIDPRSGAIDALAGHSQFGRRRDDWGNWFGCDNVTPLRHYLLTDRYLRRNVHAAPAGTHLNLARTENTRLYPISRVLSHYRGYRPPVAGEAHRFSAACATDFYRDDLLGADLHGNTFTCGPVHNVVHRRVLRPRGLTFSTERAAGEADREFLASRDSWFRPTHVRTGPDGALWVVDMYRLVIEHPEWIDDEYERQLDLRAGEDQGRIYRIVPADKPLREVPRFDRLESAELVAELSSPNGIRRDLAQRLLLEREDSAAVDLLRQLAREGAEPLSRLHALATLDGLGKLDQDTLAAALDDSHAGVLRHAVRLAESRLDEVPAFGSRLLALLPSASAQLRLQIAYSLGAWSDPRAGAALGKLAVDHRDDAMFVAAVISSLTPEHLQAAMPAVLSAPLADHDAEIVFARFTELAAAQQNRPALAQVVASLVPADGELPSAGQLTAAARLLAALNRSGVRYDAVLADGDAAALDGLIEHALEMSEFEKSSELDVSSNRAQLAAIELLGHVRERQAAHCVARLGELLVPQATRQQQVAALRALAMRPEEEVATLLLDRLDSATPSLQGRMLDVLLTRPAWTTALLDRLSKESLAPSLLSISQRQVLRVHRNQAIRQRAAELLAEPVVADRQRLVEEYLAERGDSIDVAAGAQLFARHCGSCHRVGEVGRAIGPDLAALKDRSPRTLLVAILDPSRAIEAKFRAYELITGDGRVLTGLLSAETGGSVTMLAADGSAQVVLRSDIDEIRALRKSLMPEGFQTQISKREMSDLVGYLGTLGSVAQQTAEAE